MTLDSREIAALLWLAVLAAYLLFGNQGSAIRKGALAVGGAFLAPRLLRFWCIAAGWVLGSIWLLSLIDLWTSDSLKTTVIWAFTFALLTVFRLVRHVEANAFLRETLRGVLSLTLLIEFIAEAYTLPLLVELVLVPVGAAFAAVQAFSENRKEFIQAHRLATWVLMSIGFVYVANGLYRVAGDWEAFASAGALRQFFAPVFLSLTYVPFLLGTSVYLAHERLGASLRNFIRPESLAQYAQRQALLRFRTDLDGLRRYQRDVVRVRPESRAEIRHLINDIKTLQAREKNPPFVDSDEGWSPYEATGFLETIGLSTDDYHRHYDDVWGTSCGHKKIGEERVLSDSLTYYVSGTEHVATMLKLELNVNHPNQAEDSDGCFFEACLQLLNEAGYLINEGGYEALRGAEAFDEQVGDTRLSLSKERFTLPEGCYKRTFIVQRGSLA